jgi:hypothetical protein
VCGLELLPGLPASALMAFCPVIAASNLVYKEHKTTGVTELLKRSFDYQRIRAKAWYAPIVLLMPSVMVLSYGLMRSTSSWLKASRRANCAPAQHFSVGPSTRAGNRRSSCRKC